MLADLDLLLTFRQIVEQGSFKRAADRLNRTQSAISMQMKRLEDHMGHQLMTRSSQGLNLTATGRVVLRYAEQLDRLQRGLTDEIKGFELTGEIRLGMPVDYVSDALTRILPHLKREFPNLRLTVTCHMSRHLRQMLDREEIDLAIITREEGNDQEGQLLWRDPLGWFAASDWEWASGTPLPIALFDGDCSLQDAMMADLKRLNIPYNVVMKSPHVSSLQAAVETGFAASLLPIRDCEGPNFKRLFGDQDLVKHQWDVALIHSGDFQENQMRALTLALKGLHQ